MNHRKICYNNAIYTMQKSEPKPLSPRPLKILAVIRELSPVEAKTLNTELRKRGVPYWSSDFVTLKRHGVIQINNGIVSVK